jgi:flagellar biosynthesis/type III secretory pathway protein FliH
MGYQYEYVTPEELQVKAFFDNYVIPRVKKLQEEERERLREESIKEGLREGINAGRNEGLERTIITFMKNAPRYSDSDLAVLFEVTPEFIHRLREKMKS